MGNIGFIQGMIHSSRSSTKKMRIWNAIFELVVGDLSHCEKQGIYLGEDDGTVYPIVLGNKGDWSYLETWFAYETFFCLNFFLGATQIHYLSLCHAIGHWFLVNIFSN